MILHDPSSSYSYGRTATSSFNSDHNRLCITNVFSPGCFIWLVPQYWISLTKWRSFHDTWSNRRALTLRHGSWVFCLQLREYRSAKPQSIPRTDLLFWEHGYGLEKSMESFQLLPCLGDFQSLQRCFEDQRSAHVVEIEHPQGCSEPPGFHTPQLSISLKIPSSLPLVCNPCKLKYSVQQLYRQCTGRRCISMCSQHDTRIQCLPQSCYIAKAYCTVDRSTARMAQATDS